MQVNQERWSLPLETDPLEETYVQMPTQIQSTRRSPSRNTILYPPSEFSAALWDGIAWIGGAVLLRLGVTLMLNYSAGLWIPGIVVLSIPAAIAFILATLMPRLSWVLGYRLVLVMFGLLLGGRL